jgi:hypothetical protein
MQKVFLALVVTLLYSLSAHAAPSVSVARSEARNLARSQAKFARTVARLNAAQRKQLKSLTATTGKDSDNDGVSDIFEGARGSDLCDTDSDDDGVSDGEDNYEENGDKTEDYQAKGPITSFADPTLVVNGETFTVSEWTAFRAPLASKDDLEIGLCVEVEGYKTGSGGSFAKKIKKSGDCGGSED